MVESEKARLLGTKSVGSKAREQGSVAKDVEVDFSDDNSRTDQSDRTEIGFMMCDRVRNEEHNGQQEECDGVLLIKWDEEHCVTENSISKEDMDEDQVIDMLKEWFGGNELVILESWKHWG